MKKYFIFLILNLVAQNFLFSQDHSQNSEAETSAKTATLTIVIKKMSKSSGEIVACLTGSADDFLKNCDQEAYKMVESKGRLTFQFTKIPFGKYAVSLFLDKNGNRELDTNFMGIPKEKYGFSNNPKKKFRAPTFEESVFEINKKKQKIFIRL